MGRRLKRLRAEINAMRFNRKFDADVEVGDVVVNQVPDGWVVLHCVGCGKQGAIPPEVAASVDGEPAGLCPACQTKVLS